MYSTGSIFLSTSESTSVVVTLFSGIAGYRGVWHDGASHFFIDGNVMKKWRGRRAELQLGDGEIQRARAGVGFAWLMCGQSRLLGFLLDQRILYPGHHGFRGVVGNFANL